MATIKDIASRAGVSITTVSHVINETRFVSDDLRSRVLTAMEELNYHPNALARSLRLGETNTIGLLIPDNSNPFFAEVARVIENVGFTNQYSVILCNSDNNAKKEDTYISVLSNKQIDGIIMIATSSEHDHVKELVEHGIPVVVADRDLAQDYADVVLVDNEQGGYEATCYLIGLGHRRIACITGPSDVTPSADRVRGYLRALAERNIQVESELIVPGDFRYAGGETAAAQLLKLEKRPSAILACNDVMAIGALRAIRNAGLQAPCDISVIGFDDIDIASAMSPALTTVAQPIVELASTAAQFLISRLRNQEQDLPRQRVVLETHLVLRDSCAPCAG